MSDPGPGAGEPVAPARWGLGDAIAGFSVGNVLVVVLLSVWVGATGDDGDDLPLGAIALGQVGLWVGLLGAPLWASRRKGSGHLGDDFGLRATPRDAVVGVPVGLAAQLLLVPLIYLPFQWLIENDDLERPARELADKATGVGAVALALALVVGAPIVEELFFRGLLLRSIQRRFGPRWALAGSSVAFGLAHFQGLQFPALVAVGVVFGHLAQRYGRLGPSILAHGAFNLVVVLALFVE